MNSRYYEDILAKYNGVVSRTTIGEVLSIDSQPFDCGCKTRDVVFVHLPKASTLWNKYYHVVLTICDSNRCNDMMVQFAQELDLYIDLVDGGLTLELVS